MQLLGIFGRIARPKSKLKNGNILRFFSNVDNLDQFDDDKWDKGIMNKDEAILEE